MLFGFAGESPETKTCQTAHVFQISVGNLLKKSKGDGGRNCCFSLCRTNYSRMDQVNVMKLRNSSHQSKFCPNNANRPIMKIKNKNRISKCLCLNNFY